MANRHMERCSTSQVKTVMWYYLTHVRMEKRELCCNLLVRMQTGTAIIEKSMEVPQKMRAAIQFSNSSFECCSAAAAAKSLQSCLTLCHCHPIEGSPPGSPILGSLQARTLEWIATFFSNAWKWKVKVKSESEVAQSCPTLRNPMGYSLPGSSTHGILQAGVLEWVSIAFSRYWSKENKISNWERFINFYVHSNIIYISQDMKAT